MTVPDMLCGMFVGCFDWSMQHAVVQTVGPHDLLFSSFFFFFFFFLLLWHLSA